MCNNRTSEYLTFFCRRDTSSGSVFCCNTEPNVIRGARYGNSEADIKSKHLIGHIGRCQFFRCLFYIIVQMQTNRISTFEVIMLQMKFFILCEQAH